MLTRIAIYPRCPTATTILVRFSRTVNSERDERDSSQTRLQCRPMLSETVKRQNPIMAGQNHEEFSLLVTRICCRLGGRTQKTTSMKQDPFMKKSSPRAANGKGARACFALLCLFGVLT